jgi:hypothetical protein
MRDIWLRIIVAALISLTGVFATYTWSRVRHLNVLLTGSEPIARITSSSHEVQKRPAQRLIWQSVIQSQELYSGEAVRTASNADARVEFINEGTVVDLEPDTVIEIEKKDGGVNLDFLKGNLFIRSAASGSKVILKSGEEKIALENTDVAVSKSNLNSKLDLDVVKGAVKVLAGGVDSKLAETRAGLKILSPKQGDVINLINQTLEIKWEPLAAGYIVKLEQGDSRANLKVIEEISEATSGAPVLGQSGKLNFPIGGFESGRRYIRLIAKNQKTSSELKSSIVRLELRKPVAPILLRPAPGAQVSFGSYSAGDSHAVGNSQAVGDSRASHASSASGDSQGVEFSWANPGHLEQMTIEIARTRDLKDRLALKTVANLLTYNWIIEPSRVGQTIQAKSGDEIFWRVSGRILGTSQLISSPIQSFKLSALKVGAAAPSHTTVQPSGQSSVQPKVSPSPTPSSNPSPAPSPEASPAPSPSSAGLLSQLAAPVLYGDKDKDIVGLDDGSVNLAWAPIAGAKEYLLSVKGADGAVVRSLKMTGTKSRVTGLATGKYSAVVQSLDTNGSLSAEGDSRTIKIPEYSAVRAPRIKKLNVK